MNTEGQIAAIYRSLDELDREARRCVGILEQRIAQSDQTIADFAVEIAHYKQAVTEMKAELVRTRGLLSQEASQYEPETCGEVMFKAPADAIGELPAKWNHL